MKSPHNESDSSMNSGGVLTTPEYDVQEKAKTERDAKWQATDFQKLNQELGGNDRRTLQHRTLTDNLIDALTPIMIFIMMYSVISYLLDVRFIFSEAEHVYIRLVAVCLIFGVVALNRLIARDGAADSILYALGLAGAAGMFTFATSTWYVGSVARGFMNTPVMATILNMSILVFVWWVTNRLTHECCVDENETAGDVGILTGTLRNFKKASAEQAQASPYDKKKTWREKMLVPKKSNDTRWDIDEVAAVDPSEWTDPSKVVKEEKTYEAPSKRMAKRHPGISIFYFAVLAMGIFALGLPALRAGGKVYELRGHLHVGAYTIAALSLLLLTSLGGLRQYFRSRDVYFPTMIGVFWLGLGSAMVFAVLIGAMRMPMPTMAPMANIDQHEKGFFEKDSTFTLERGPVTGLAQTVNDSGVLDTIGTGVLILFAFFFLYAMMRGVGGVAAWVGRHRAYFPNWVFELFKWLDRFLERVVRMPSLPQRKRRLHIKRGVSQSIHFASQMRGEGEAHRDQTTQYVAHAYDALCALAYDMGVPKLDDQTPYEFIHSFPKELKGIQKDAQMLTDLYVRAAYSELELDKRALDKLRHFWFTYESIRRRYIR